MDSDEIEHSEDEDEVYGVNEEDEDDESYGKKKQKADGEEDDGEEGEEEEDDGDEGMDSTAESDDEVSYRPLPSEHEIVREVLIVSQKRRPRGRKSSSRWKKG